MYCWSTEGAQTGRSRAICRSGSTRDARELPEPYVRHAPKRWSSLSSTSSSARHCRTQGELALPYKASERHLERTTRNLSSPIPSGRRESRSHCSEGRPPTRHLPPSLAIEGRPTGSDRRLLNVTGLEQRPDLIHGALGWLLQILQQFCRIVDSFVRGHATAFGQRFGDGLFSKCMAR